MGGGIGITPMIAMAHRLHAIGADFEVHYSVEVARHAPATSTTSPACRGNDRVLCSLHRGRDARPTSTRCCRATRRAGTSIPAGRTATCRASSEAAERQGFPEEARHLEYFSVPEMPEWGEPSLHAAAGEIGPGIPRCRPDKTATDVLAENGIHIDVKCSDGICGVCKCGLVSGEVEHRDFVLSKKQREGAIILCQSRAAEDGGMVDDRSLGTRTKMHIAIHRIWRGRAGFCQ